MIYLFGKNQLRGKASYIACMSLDSQRAGSCRWSGRSPEPCLPVQRPRGALSCASSPGSVSGRLPSEVAGQPSAWSLEESRCPRAALPCTAREMPVTPPASPPPSPAPAWFGFLRLAFPAVHALQLTTSCSLFLAPSAALTPGLLHLSVLTQREGVASLRKPCALGVKEPSFLAEYHLIRGPHPPGAKLHLCLQRHHLDATSDRQASGSHRSTWPWCRKGRGPLPRCSSLRRPRGPPLCHSACFSVSRLAPLHSAFSRKNDHSQRVTAAP